MLIPLGLNLAALAWLAALAVSFTEPGGLALRWTSWWWPAGVGAAVGLLAFRFPRSAGLPLLGLTLVAGLLVASALQEFSLPRAGSVPTVQPLTDRETVTIFSARVDWVGPLQRFRPQDSPPSEWWWPWAASQGWARSQGVLPPEEVLRYGVYRLSSEAEGPQWRLEKPLLSPPDPRL